MFERLNYLYHAGKITAEQLDRAVSKAWINRTRNRYNRIA